MYRVVGAGIAAAALCGLTPGALAQETAMRRGPMVPAEVVLPDLTPAEATAHRLWSLRAALNVAALQCQFSPFLRTVANYNEMLPMHAAELDGARRTLVDHFKKADKAAAQRNFDQYTTRTYNSFSTLDAQIGFCDTAAQVGASALATPRGQLGLFAEMRLPEIRASLTPSPDPLAQLEFAWVEVPPIANPCLDRRGRLKRRC